jgi:hypothetical protein
MAITTTPDLRPGDVQVDPVLTNIAISYKEPAFLAPLLFPKVTVENKDGRYPVYFNEEQLIIEDDHRGPSAESREEDWPMSKDTYQCEDHARKRFLADQTLKNASDPGARRVLEISNRIEFLKRKTLRGWEKNVADALTTYSNYNSSHTVNLDTGTANFDDTGVNGAKTIDGWIEQIALATGADPSDMVMISAGDCWNLIRHDDNFKPNTNSGAPTTQEFVREMFGFRDVLVHRSIYSPTKKGQAASRTRLWLSNSIVIAVVPPSASLDTPAIGYTFVWNGQDGAVDGETVCMWRDANNRGGGGDWVEYSFYHDPKITGVNASSEIVAGFLGRNAYSTL